ncbi:hypothetical protein [Vibrio alginolyticus]
MLSSIKALFITDKDYTGRDIDTVIMHLPAQTNIAPLVWSYTREFFIYENTTNGMKIYPHELKN